MADNQHNTTIPPASPPSRVADLGLLDRSAFMLAFGEEMQATPEGLPQDIHDRAMPRVHRFFATRNPSEAAGKLAAFAPAPDDAPRQVVSPDAALIALCAQHIRNLEAYNSGGARSAAEDASLWTAYVETRDAIGAAVPETADGMVAKALAAKAEARHLAGEERPDGTPATAWAMALTNDILRLHRRGLTPPTSPEPTPTAKPAAGVLAQLDVAIAAMVEIELATNVLCYATPDHANAGGLADTSRLVTERLRQHTAGLETALKEAWALMKTPDHLAQRHGLSAEATRAG